MASAAQVQANRLNAMRVNSSSVPGQDAAPRHLLVWPARGDQEAFAVDAEVPGIGSAAC